jgi:predicted  nucleic acid-binding Zn-ribbon protein
LLETIQKIQTRQDDGNNNKGGPTESDIEDLEEELMEKEMQIVELEQQVEKLEDKLGQKDKQLTSKMLEVFNF